MTKKRMKISETALLKRRWCMLIANAMVEEECVPRSQALTKAYMVWDVLDGLGRGIMPFTYYDCEGNLREARGTLKQGVSRTFDKWLGSRHKERHRNTDGDDHFVYWDVDEEGWRSFKASRLVSVGEVTIHETGEFPVAPVNDNQID